MRIGTPGQGGTQSIALAGAVFNKLGCTLTDVQGEINDWSPGLYTTFGRFDPCASNDDWFHSDVIVIWANNPAYSEIPLAHYISEARYHGTQVVIVAPDYSPSAIHADVFVPVRIGSDAALALAMCRVILDEGLMDRAFVREQTDLPLLVRTDTGRFLRQQDVAEGGRDDIFYFFDKTTQQIVEAPQRLELGDAVPALHGTFAAALAGGVSVEVEPVFARLERLLKDYTPEAASAVCGAHPDVIRKIARMVAAGKTHVLDGWTFGKSYHGDLMERSICLVLALTGNWGKQGAGIRSWAVGMFDGMFTWSAKAAPGPEAARNLADGMAAMAAGLKAKDPSLTDEILVHAMGYQGAAMGGNVPPAFFWLNHCGYRETWEKNGWGDPGMKRSFSAYVQEAIDRGWWQGSQYPAPETAAAGIVRDRRQHAAANARRPAAAVEAPLAEAQADRLDGREDDDDGDVVGHRAAGGASLREAELPVHDAERDEPDAVGPRGRAAGGHEERVAVRAGAGAQGVGAGDRAGFRRVPVAAGDAGAARQALRADLGRRLLRSRRYGDQRDGRPTRR